MQFSNRKWLLAASVAGVISVGLGACQQGTATKQVKAPPSSQVKVASSQEEDPAGNGGSWAPPKEEGVDEPAKPAVQPALNPGQTCSSPETIKNVKLLIVQEGLHQAHLYGHNYEALMYSPRFLSQMHFDSIIVAGVDHETKKVSCEAHFVIRATDAVRAQSGITAFADTQLSYSIQPTADGTDNVYSIVDASHLAASAMSAADHISSSK